MKTETIITTVERLDEKIETKEQELKILKEKRNEILSNTVSEAMQENGLSFADMLELIKNGKSIDEILAKAEEKLAEEENPTHLEQDFPNGKIVKGESNSVTVGNNK